MSRGSGDEDSRRGQLDDRSARLFIESKSDFGPTSEDRSETQLFIENPPERHRPLEIASRTAPSRGEVGSPRPSKRTPDSRPGWKRAPRIIVRKRAKIIIAVAVVVVAIVALGAAFVMRGAFKMPDGKSTSGDEDEPNPPTLPESMELFYPPQNEEEAEAMRATLRKHSDPTLTWEEYSENSPRAEGYPSHTFTTENHFSSRRTALLFAPGTYPNLDFEVGYYTSVLGLGEHPADVRFTDCDKGPYVPAMEKFSNRPPNGSGLDTFWRSIENIATNAREGMRWVVSQAAPLRRVHVQTDLNLFEGDSWVSGGVAANVLVDGEVNFGGQQQWLMRNVELSKGAVNGAWSLVFVGCTGNVPRAKSGLESGPSISVEDSPRLRVEKPYIVLKTADGSTMQSRDLREVDNSVLLEGKRHWFELRVPAASFGKYASGVQFEGKNDDARDFRRVKLGVPSYSTDPAAAASENYSVLQKALDQGKDLVLAPGIFLLSQSLAVKHPNQVVLGLGYATLVAPPNGSPCIRIHSGVPGVRIAGIMLEASSPDTNGNRMQESSLLEWGEPASNDPGDPSNPGVLSDIFARVGGVQRDVSTNAMIKLNSGNIYGDNLWLWRADHSKLKPKEEPNFPQISSKYWQTLHGECQVENGLVVNTGATNVTVVGLAVEHTTEDQTVWNGDHGQVYFYQCEFPYDVDNTFGDKNYVGYRVGPQMTNHKAMGLGIYSNFRDYNVKVETAVVHPERDNIHMDNIFTVKLDNQGFIGSVVNGRGPGATAGSEMGHPLRCPNELC